MKVLGPETSSPASVIESIMVMYHFIFAWPSLSLPYGRKLELNPGNIDKREDKVPCLKDVNEALLVASLVSHEVG
jgi:hypothetical protein